MADNLGGFSFLTGLVGGYTQARLNSQEHQREINERREQMLYKYINDVDVLSPVFEMNKNKYNEMIGGFDSILNKISQNRKGEITQDDIITVINLKNRINSAIGKIKEEEEYVTNQVKNFQSDKGKTYDQQIFQQSYQAYLKGTSLKDVGEWLVPKPIDPGTYAQQLKISDQKAMIGEKNLGGGRVQESYSWGIDDNIRTGKWTSEFSSNRGLQRGIISEFESLKEKDPDTWKRYADQAMVIQQDSNIKNKLFNDIPVNAAYLYSVDKYAKQIQPDYTETKIRWKPEEMSKDKEIKVIPKTGSSWQFNDSPVTLTGVMGTDKVIVTELVENPEGKQGLFFKVIVPNQQKSIPVNIPYDQKVKLEAENKIKERVEYVPYDNIKNLVEKKYKFEGTEGYKRPMVGVDKQQVQGIKGFQTQKQENILRGTRSQLEQAAKQKGMTIADYEKFLNKQGYKIEING